MLRLLQVTCVMCEADAAGAGAGPADAGGGGGEFVDGWLVAQVLGEGAYGEVRLLLHRGSGAAVALKAVRGAGRREAALHGALRHAHVLRCLGARAHGDAHYLFLEYAAGGELFERIEPDRGMAAPRARTYWRQLAAGLRYLHARGVAHRDIKPENLLLDAEDRIKISDFGLATVFRHGARERRLSRVCGTPPYCAPEVLCAAARPYRAQPADAWAAAVVLLAMLAGELPWERAHAGDARYAEWSAWSCGRGVARPPGVWRRVAGGALAWLRRALHPEPARRAGLEELARDAWLAAPHAPDERAALAGGGGAGARGCLSQPAGGGGGGGDEADGGQLSPADMAEALLSYSQPAHADDLLLGTQAEGWAGGAGAEGWATARRMTRVWVRGDAAAALRALAAALRDRHYTWRHLGHTHLAIECGPEVRMRAWAGPGAAAGAGDVTLLEFRRARGCGLEFKRRFVELRAALEPLSVPAPGPHPHPQPAPAPAAPAPEPMDHT